MLAPVHASFSEGFATPDWIEAQQMLSTSAQDSARTQNTD